MQDNPVSLQKVYYASFRPDEEYAVSLEQVIQLACQHGACLLAVNGLALPFALALPETSTPEYLFLLVCPNQGEVDEIMRQIEVAFYALDAAV